MAPKSPNLLSFQRSLLSEIADPKTSDLILLARGLGLRRIVCTLLQIYDGPQNLVLLVNTNSDEEKGIGSELGIMGVRNPGLRIVDYEMSKKDRQLLYRKGGLISVTSRILVVDLLSKEIPIELITGMVILHADKVSPTSLEAFIVRLYRNINKDGFVKAFSDQPESFAQGMFPLKSVMTELQVRRAHIYPRFHEQVQSSLGRRKADVVELYVPLTNRMRDIHQSIVHCISATLNELKKSNSTLDLDDFSVENAYFKSFDSIVRRQLDPVWHKVGMKTKQLVADLATLRRLLVYLLTLDPISFHSYLETIVSSNSSTGSHPLARQEKSDWLFTEAAHIIITTAKARCYTMDKEIPAAVVEGEDDDQWEALDEIEGHRKSAPSKSRKSLWRAWMPKQMQPVLEEPGKWSVLADVLLEIEQEIISRPSRLMEPGTNFVLVMVSDTRTATLLQDFLSSMHNNPDAPGRSMLLRRLRSYLYWKSLLVKAGENASDSGSLSRGSGSGDGMSEALRRKDQDRATARGARRRVRGGGAAAVVSDRERKRELERTGLMPNEADMEMEAETIAEFLATQPTVLLDDELGESLTFATAPQLGGLEEEPNIIDYEAIPEMDFHKDFDHYGLLTPEQSVVIRAYGEDEDDQILSELRPRYIVMYDPNQDFVRRIEVYRSSNPGLAVRVYFMLYHLTSEEHKYLAGQRREKDSFERLIKERGSMLLTIGENMTASYSDRVASLSSRIGGGQRDAPAEPPRVIVDMREFRSSLPNLIDKARMHVLPATLTVGDYILSPDMCVERKSLPDLIQSFTSGRLYTQCELMCFYYTYPILLIEFEESKAFSLQTIADTKAGPRKKPNDQNPSKMGPKPSGANDTLIQSKLVLLTLSFPRLRIIWSSSPHASVEIIKELKANFPEPDVLKAISKGVEEDAGNDAELEDVNTLAEDLVRALPGIRTKNLRYVMERVDSVTTLCELSLKELQKLLGVDPGTKCYTFIRKGSKRPAAKGQLS